MSDTIFAIATGAGKSAIAIIRVSGPQCEFILRRLCRRNNWPKRQAILADLIDLDGAALDRAIVLVFDAPRSYTGENMIEFQITGGRGVKSALIRNLMSVSNTRVAEPGEFARRAFENGKIDLVQVEGLAAIVDAETLAAVRNSAIMAFGGVSQECEKARLELLQAAALLEGFLDFSDVEDPSSASLALVRGALERARIILQSLIFKARVSERLRDGFAVAIVGKPNAGKSTLINHILQRDAALVSDIPGTTRDSLEFFVEFDGFPIVFVDTAGFRLTLDPVEALGIERSKERVRIADLILWLSDTEHHEDAFLPEDVKTIKIRSKCDLPTSDKSNTTMAISALTGEGIGKLIDLITECARIYFEDAAEPGLGTERQIAAVSAAIKHVERALAFGEIAEELLAEEVRASLTAIGRVTGRVDVEEVLDEVFSRLCVGK